MRIVILGASRFGFAIADTLIEAEHEVVIIDKSRERLETLAERLDCGMLTGDGTMPSTLREVWRDERDVFVAVTNASEDNILACLVARSVGFGRVIPQIVASELMTVCEELDLKDAINPHATVAQDVAEALEDRAELDHDTALNNQLALKRVHVPARLDGTRLADLDLPDGARAVAVIRDEEENLPEAETTLQAEDHILMVAAREALDALSDMFAED
ncbi:Trk system potassium uptake protein TrkA [Roseibacterium elongatum DSM 19469]|uniref:Trk system potassium uptake protein TrkA n=1 Tax=Roseicyclus elongatus DSM 19469 TaxID=1294273 RepID=W8S4I0_9RHOB|nr:NAD-binding protein [Roseibacterium elongatum]AHM05112.1 Trk system potassium uptake protein TrkA [Roseibacterium elongatum DSM 19469]